MNLVVDIGNTRTKAAVFEQNKLIEQWNWEREKAPKNLLEVFKNYSSITHSMIASVGNTKPELIGIMNDNSVVLELNAHTKVPFTSEYETPETLGVDRIAVVGAAYFSYPKENCLVIDAGSCITYEILSSDGVYSGGAIAPGLQMRFNAVHQQTEKLPLLSLDLNTPSLGKSTESSIQAGIVNGIIFEIEGWIQQTKSQMENLTVILTGGDANFLSKRLKNTIFAHPNFVLEGINYILEYNKLYV